MTSPGSRPSRRGNRPSFHTLVEHAQALRDQGQQAIGDLNALRARLRLGRARADQALLHAYAAMQHASDELDAIRGSRPVRQARRE